MINLLWYHHVQKYFQTLPYARFELMISVIMTQTSTYNIFLHTIISIIFAIKKWCWSKPTLEQVITMLTTTAIINHSIFFEKRFEEIAWNAHFAEIKTFDCAAIIVENNKYVHTCNHGLITNFAVFKMECFLRNAKNLCFYQGMIITIIIIIVITS